MAEFNPNDELLPPYSRLNEPTFESLARARRGDGFTHLGTAIGKTAGGLLGGNDLRGQQVFNQAATGTARLQDILLQARQRRDAEIGRQAAAADAQKTDPALANLYLQGKVTPQGLGAYNLDTQKFTNIGDATDLANQPNPDMNLLNRRLMVIHGQPVQLTKDENHAVLNPYVTPESQTPGLDPLGTAMVGTQHATAAERAAQAGTANARTAYITGPQTDAMNALTNQRDTKTNATPASRPNHLPPTALAALLGVPDEKGAMHIDPQRMADFIGVRDDMREAGDPTWNDDAAVFQAYKQKRIDADNQAMAAANAGAAPTNLGDAASPVQPTPTAKTVVRTGTDQKTGKKVVQYNDGSIEAAP